jgi:chromosome segregation ATPase
VSSKAAEARLAELEKQHLAYRTEVESELIVLQDKIEGIVRERDRAVRDAAQLAEQRRCELEKHAEMLAAIEHEHTSVIRAREELAKRLTETERVRAQLESERYPEATSSGVLAELAALKVQLDAERARAREAASQLEEAQLGLEASAAVLRETEVRLASVSRSEADLRLELEAFVVSAAGTPNRDLSGGGDETAAAVVQGASEKCVREFEEPHLFGERGEAGAELELLPMPEEPLANGPRVRPKARPRQARLK